MKLEHVSRTWNDILLRPKQWKRDMTFSTWIVSSLYTSGSLTALARELATYKLDLVSIQEIRWGKGAW